MLLEWAQTKEERAEARELWDCMRLEGIRNGRKDINLGNFIDLNASYCNYVIEGHCYKGYFTKQDIDIIFKILDYHEGRIKTLNG